jgi:TatD DNase family protein
MSTISYIIDTNLYLNITNRCTNACVFCIRNKAREFQGEHKLWLDHEPDTAEILGSVGDPNHYHEIVFCGYGEPLIRLETVKEVSRAIKAKGPTKIRVNTNGHANLFYQRNILPELKGLVDRVSVSLNAENDAVYNAICNSFFGSPAFPAVVSFIIEAKKYIPEVEASAVDLPQVDIEKAKKLAEGLGVPFRVRYYYEDEYVR